MYKTIFIVRHAEANLPKTAHRDFDRTLSNKGNKDAQKMGKLLFEAPINIDCIISSAAIRAINTAKLIAKENNIPEEEVIKNEDLYFADAKQILNIISALDNKWNTVMIVGHNPTVSTLIEKLCHQSFGNIPPATVIGIKLTIKDWAAVSIGLGSPIYEKYPQDSN